MVSLNPDDLGWEMVVRYSSADDADAMRRLLQIQHPKREIRVVKRSDQLDKQFVVQWRYYPKHAK